MDVFLTVYPWDLHDEGLEACLDRMCGEIGVAGVSVWAAAPAVRLVRAREISPRIVHEEGGVYFLPNEQLYQGTRIKPPVASAAKHRCPLLATLNACRDRNLAVRAIISASRMGMVTRRHESVACKNAFGQVSRVNACLCNPDIQSFIRGMISDLRSIAGLSSITVRDWQSGWNDVFEEPWHTSRPLSELEKRLLGTCFCESCFQRAEAGGIDAGAAHRIVVSLLNRFLSLADGLEQRWESLLAETPVLAKYIELQHCEQLALIEKAAEAGRDDLMFDEPIFAGSLKSTNANFPETTLIIPVSATADFSRLVRSSAVGARHVRFSAQDVVAMGSNLVARLSDAAAQGISSVEIDNYVLLPDSTLTFLKQAIRFARRQS